MTFAPHRRYVEITLGARDYDGRPVFNLVLHAGVAMDVVYGSNDYGDAILAAERYEEEGFEVVDTVGEDSDIWRCG